MNFYTVSIISVNYLFIEHFFSAGSFPHMGLGIEDPTVNKLDKNVCP